MARIQKKKPAAQKKKPRSQTAEDYPAANGGSIPAASSPESPQASTQGAAKEKKPKRPAAAKKSAAAEQSFVLRLVDRYFGNWIDFLREVKVELGKVTWPSRKQTVGSTVVVLVFVFVIALFLGLIDIVLSSLVRLII